MKIPVKKFILAGRIAAVFVTVCALIACGATAAERQAAMIAAQQKANLAKVSASDLLEPSPTEVARGEMDSGEAPNVEPAAWLVPTGLVKTGNDELRARPQQETTPVISFNSNLTPKFPNPATTPPRVSSSLGRQFTLVGAKPSGTS